MSGWGGETPVVYTNDLFGAEKVVSAWSRVEMRDVMRARYGDMPPPLYVIHTSGSTGTPKGVALPLTAFAPILSAHGACPDSAPARECFTEGHLLLIFPL